jgi:hypothetical protein
MTVTPEPPEPDWETMSGIASIESEFSFESAEQVTSRQITTRTKHRKLISAIKAEELADFYKEIPAQGETVHMVSNGRWDYWLLAPRTQELVGEPCSFSGSTWTMNRNNVIQLLALYDTGRFTTATILTGTYFKARESSVANTLIEGLTKRGQRYLAFQNHAKVMLLGFPKSDNWITIEGSANFTANPRCEQNNVIQLLALFDFHLGWMETMLQTKPR